MNNSTDEFIRFEGSDEPFVKPTPIARLYGVSAQTPLRWAKRYGCPCMVLPSGGYRFRASDVERSGNVKPVPYRLHLTHLRLPVLL